MSPASAGNLEVERYIGACLITQNRKNNHRVHNEFFHAQRGNFHHYQDPWIGGLPLISYANHQRLNEDPNPLTRLAVHTHGAPLIVTKSYHHRKNKQQRNNNNFSNNGRVYENSNKQLQQQKSNDAVSVTSDESSASNNSENCLPRIIKPRKRRKKDRKPPALIRPLSQDGFSTDSASPDVDNNRIFINFPFVEQSLFIDMETPKLHHSFEDVEEPDKDVNGNQSTCQCRYCDPSGQIWDVDRSCYSSFLTPPLDQNKTFDYSNLYPLTADLEQGFSSISLEDKKSPPSRSSSSSSCRDLEVSTEIVTSLNGHRDLEIKFFSASSVEKQ